MVGVVVALVPEVHTVTAGDGADCGWSCVVALYFHAESVRGEELLPCSVGGLGFQSLPCHHPLGEEEGVDVVLGQSDFE